MATRNTFHLNAVQMERRYQRKRSISSTSGSILAVLFLLVIFFMPVWPYSVAWGFYPVMAFGAVLSVFLVAIMLSPFFTSERE